MYLVVQTVVCKEKNVSNNVVVTVPQSSPGGQEPGSDQGPTLGVYANRYQKFAPAT